MEIAVLSKPGGRTHNEDACGYWTSDGLCCWVVSDGAGGHGGGDVASKLVVGTVLREFAAAPQMSQGSLTDLLHKANNALLANQRNERRLMDMRATVAVLVLDRGSGSALWGHVGDSRIYCFRNGALFYQTRDHSVVQGLLDMGAGDPSWLRSHPQRNILLAALGSEDEFNPAIEERPLAVRDGDAFLLCSDGLWEYVEEPVMAQTLGECGSPREWLDAMEQELLRRCKSGHDNYSGLAIWLGDPSVVTRTMGQQPPFSVV
jgi:serine/threonine protein phosphatase PrpC